MVVRLCFFGFSFPVILFGASFLFFLSSFRLHALAGSIASDAHHRGPLEPAGVEGHAADDIEVIPGRGRERQIGTPVAAIHDGKRRRGVRAVQLLW